LAAGILPDRQSPWRVDLPVATNLLQDANAQVRLEALLAFSELPQSQRGAGVLMDVISAPENSRDPWMPDAVAIAAAREGPTFLVELVKLRPPPVAGGGRGAGGGGAGGGGGGGGRGGALPDSLNAGGMGRTTRLLAHHFASLAQPATMVTLVSAIQNVGATSMAIALLDGISAGWPQGTVPEFSADQRAALAAVARGASPDVTNALGRVAARWGLPDVFK
jgi:hypothetical protein